MKKYLLYLVLFFIGSCSVKEVLYDTLTTENSFSTKDDVTSFINGTYATFNINCFKSNYAPFFATGDDIFGTTGGNLIYPNRTHNPTSAPTAGLWNGFYKAINQANFILSRIDSTDIDSLFKVRTKCEAKFLRAFSYFYLVRTWGAVPLKLTPTTSTEGFKSPRVSVDSVYQQIFADLLDAKVSLYRRTAQPAAEFNRATKGAAFGYLAKAYQAYGNYLDLKGDAAGALTYYQLSENYCDSVLLSGQYNLVQNVKDLFDVAKERDAYNEVLFGIAYMRDAQVANTPSLGSQLPGFFLPNSMPNVAGNGVNKTGVANFRLQPWFVDKYTSGDYAKDYRGERFFASSWTNTSGRRQITFPAPVAVGTNIIEGAPSSPYLFKYVDGQSFDSQNAENDFFALRLADIILTKAEMENEINGPTASAYTEFNKIRARARAADGITSRTTPPNLTSGLTKEQFRAAIVNERAIELVGEGVRWFDLCRMKSPSGTTMFEYQLNTVIPTYPAGYPVFDTLTKTWKGGRTDSVSVPKFQQKFLLMPIPQNAEIVLNSSINSQNPGY